MSKQIVSRSFDSFTDTGGLPLNAALINERLNDLWERSLSETHGEAAYTRVTLADLVIIADSSSLARAEKLSQRFAQERPSRSILLLIDDTAPENSDCSAEIGIACSLSAQGEDMLCWEKISVHLPRARLGAAPNIVRSLTSGVKLLVIVDLLPSLFGELMNSDLYDIADYVFFDSRINRRKLAAKIQAGRGNLARLFDLEYERDHPLREAIKAAFDDPGAMRLLPELKQVNIHAPSLSGFSLVRAMYVCGWLSAKLKLTYVRHRTRRKIIYRDINEREIEFHVSSHEKSSHQSSGATVEFCFGENESQKVSVRPTADANNNTGKVSIQYEITRDGSNYTSPPPGELEESEYMLRRIGDTRHRGDYTESLRRALTLLYAGSRGKPADSGISVLRSPNPALLMQKTSDLFVEIMRESVIRHGAFTVALAGGGTPVNLYRRLSESVYATCSEWADSYFFFGDERAVPPTHEDSNFLMARRNIFKRLEINPDRVFRMAGERDNLGDAAEEYQQVIERTVRDKSPSGYPSFDLILLGLGPDGHTASVFPDYPENEIGEEQLVASVYVGSKQAHRLTFTPTLINAARNIMILVSGEEKARAVFETIVERSTPAARIRPEYGRLFFCLDNSAAQNLDMSHLLT